MRSHAYIGDIDLIPYYHVRITQKSRRSYEVKLDLLIDDLENRLLEPYRRGRPITFGGKTIEVDDIERIRISKTEADSNSIRPIVEHELRSDGVIVVAGPSTEWYVADKGEDVTDSYITKPPGHESTVNVEGDTQSHPPTDKQAVFVVHGRNQEAGNALFTFLRSIALRPLECSEAVKSTGKSMPYIGEILDAAFSRAHAVLVLLTPDDETCLRPQFRSDRDPPHEVEPSGQARPNVLFEAGMAMGRNHERTILVELGVLRPFSDIAGLHVIRLDDTPQRRQDLAQRLQTAGCPVNLDGSDWHGAGDFDSAIKLTQTPPYSSTIAEHRSTATGEPRLSEHATGLLAEAANADGSIYKISTAGGLMIKANGKLLGEPGDPQSEATWEGAISDLVDSGLVNDRNGEDKRFVVTREGFDVAERLKGTR